jgi:hypothetical protein
MPPITVTREEMYRLVWETPMSKLAAKFGISDVGMAKICRRWGIPKPGRGHWVRLAAGEKIKRPPLPKANPRSPESFEFNYDENPPPKPPRVEPPSVPISDDLSTAAKPIQSIGKALNGGAVDSHGRLIIAGENEPVFAVTVEAHRRALLLLDSLSKALSSKGHTTLFKRDDAGGSRHWKLGFVVDGEFIAATLIERLDREDHVLTADEERRAKQGDRFGVPKYDYHPDGRLQISLPAKAASRGGSWSDSETQRLEHHLGRVVLAVEEAAAGIKRGRVAAERHREDEEKRQRERELEEVRRRAEERRAQHRELLAKDLVGKARAWSDAEEIRRFLAALDAAMPTDGRSDGFKAWFEWAKTYTAEIDPLARPDDVAKHLEPEFAGSDPSYPRHEW